MPNSSNDNSYLILYLIIILVLLYAITFMSGYTCNIAVQPTDTFKQKENFNNYYEDDEYNEDEDNVNSEYYPNGVPVYPYEDFQSMNDQIENFESSQGGFQFIGIGNDNQIYTQNVVGGVWNPTCTVVPGSCCVIDVAIMPNGVLYGLDPAGSVWVKQNLNATWARHPYLIGKFKTISVRQDARTLMFIGQDNFIYAYDTLGQEANASLIYNSSQFAKMIELLNGQVAAVGLDNKFYITQGTLDSGILSTGTSNIWGPMPGGGAGLSISQAPDGSINVVGTDGIIYTMATMGASWVKTPTGTFISLCTTMPIPGSGTLASPPLTPNDYTVVMISGNSLCVKDIIGGAWNSAVVRVANSGSVTDITITPTGVIYGIGMNGLVWSRQTLNSSWVNEKGIAGQFRSISVLQDGHTLILIGMNYVVYQADVNALSSGATEIYDSAGYAFLKIIQLQNGQFFAVGTNNIMYMGNGQLVTGQITWTQWSNAGRVMSIAQAPDTSLVCISPDYWPYTFIRMENPEYSVRAPTEGYSAIAIMQIPPQTINGYTRKGAFIDNANRTIPNLLGNFNTLPECINAAQAKGYNTVGFQDMNYCFGGNNSPYDSLGFQTDPQLNVSAYPGAWTNIVYKTDNQLVTTADPVEGETYVYQACQFGGSGSKMTIGQYPNLNDSVEIKSVKLGPNTKLSLFALPNFGGASNIMYGNSDVVNKDAACIDFTFSSAKVEIYPNAMPSKPINLTNAQLSTLWTQAGCKAESVAFNQTYIDDWKKNFPTIASIVADMKQWATLTDPKHQQGCYTLAPQPDSPSEGEVVLFEACDFGGRYKKYGMGNVSFVGNDFNDITSAIKIGPFTSLTIYENSNYEGKSMMWKNDTNAISPISCLTANNFNDMLSSLKVTSSTAQVSFNLSLQAAPVSVLGPWNTVPWNTSFFADQTAQWIWWTNKWAGGFPNGSAPIDPKPIRFQVLVPITGNRDIPAMIHIIADNAPQGANFIRVNGKLIGQIMDGGWVTPNYTKIQTSLAPGNNLIEFDVQNTGGAAGILASIINTNTFEVIANSGIGQWGWVDPSIIVTSLALDASEKLNIHDEAAKGKIVKFKNLNDMPPMMVGGTFRLCVNLTSVPPYIKGQQYKTGDTNQFYLSIEKIDPNCQVQDGGKCMNIYVDNKKCANAVLSNVSRANAYRLVIVSKAYVLDPNIPFGKNVDFTLIKIGEKTYLKNVQTGYMPKLLVNDYKQQLYGYMDTSYLSNITSLKSNQNKLCGANATVAPPSEESSGGGVGAIFGKAMGGLLGKTSQEGEAANQKFVNCTTNADGSTYMMTTTNLVESNPIKFVLNKDGTVSIRLQQFNVYGNIDKTFSLVFCNFNVNTYAFIEKLTNPLGTFLINMVCFDPDDKRQLPNNTLNFSVEMSKYPDSYLIGQNILNLNV
jgi:hypothetical protein